MKSFLVFAPCAGPVDDQELSGEDTIRGRAEALKNTRWMAQQTIDRVPQAFSCSRLLDGLATRELLEAELTACGGLAFYGHGNPDSLAGADAKPAVGEDNVAALAGRWAHALACRSAGAAPGTSQGGRPVRSGIELADLAVAAGAQCFAGYQVTLIMEWLPENIPEPIYETFSELVTITTFNLAAGVRDQKTLARAVNRLADQIVAWCNRNPDTRAGLFEVTAQQLAGRLVVKPGS